MQCAFAKYTGCLGAEGSKRVATSIVEAFGEKGRARDLEEVLRLEYRSKLLNPKWAQVGPAGLLACNYRSTSHACASL